jgi:hypothetical protein
MGGEGQRGGLLARRNSLKQTQAPELQITRLTSNGTTPLKNQMSLPGPADYSYELPVAAQARRACGPQHETRTRPRRCLTLPGSASL